MKTLVPVARERWDLIWQRYNGGTEALNAIITYGFTVLKLAGVGVHTYSHNAKAKRVLEKAGFKVDSIGEDSHHYILCRMDWEQKPANSSLK